MDQADLSLSVVTDHIGGLVQGKRGIFYDEMAQYGPRYIEGEAGKLASVDAECRYHLNNLVLLSMYFDIVFIQTSALFNVNDLFLRSVIQRTISHPKFRAMLKSGSVRICGWGGRSPREMFSNAWNFARAGVTQELPDSYASDLKSVFLPEHLTFRMQGAATDETGKFRARLWDTNIISRTADLDRVEEAIRGSENQLGELAAISFFPRLGLQSMHPVSRAAVFASYTNSWCDHLNSAVPDVHVYLSATNASAVQHTISLGGKHLRSFLFSPRIFAAFLQRYFSIAEFNRIMSRPYEDIHNLRNGDWKRFCEAYHTAVEMISASISDIDFSMIQMFGLEDQAAWGGRIWDAANKKSGDFDVNAFLQSLAGMSGVLLTIPIVGPVIHVAGVIAGRRINGLFHKLVREHGSKTSAYIRKVRMNLALQTSTA